MPALIRRALTTLLMVIPLTASTGVAGHALTAGYSGPVANVLAGPPFCCGPN